MKTKHWIIGVLVFILILGGGAALDLGFGYFGVLKTRTVGKAQQDADREVFESTQSHVEGKRQEAGKAYREWNQAKDVIEKKAIANGIAHNFANFDIEKLQSYEVREWVRKCINGTLTYPEPVEKVE